MKKRIRFVKGVLIPKVSQIYEVDPLDVDFVVKSTLKFKSLKDLDSEGLDEVINYLDQMLLSKNYDINLDYYDKIERKKM